METLAGHSGAEPTEVMLDELADAICRRELAAPAIFLLESVRPLNFIGSQFLHALGPLAGLFVDGRRVEMLAGALEDRETIGRLVAKIESRGAGSSPGN